jgi:1-phosphatidylinositol-4-phosphate 5-kinase
MDWNEFSYGKSGSIFFYSHDDKYLLKTISETEAKTLMEMLEKYYDHIHSGPTLLAPIVGLYKLTTKQGKDMNIVVTKNVFSTVREMHIIYDLKGSTVGRSTLEKGTTERKRGRERRTKKNESSFSRLQSVTYGSYFFSRVCF